MVERQRRVVVGVSQSLAGLAAIRYAIRAARERGTPLYALRTWALPAHWRGPAVDAWQYELSLEARRYVVGAFDAALGGPPDLDVFVAAPYGRADHVLTATADGEDDLLVLGGRGGFWRRPSWIVRGCIGAARCPVIVVPPPAMASETGPLALRSLFRAVARLDVADARHHERPRR
ncbi:MAG TPA: universal stress protein [Dactylosporangium sp.]|nr:universal stress protein [Dactylosporangium sp.]